MAEEKTVKPSVFERHLQTGIQLILVMLLGWAGLKLVDLGENTAVLQERLVYQGEQISSLRRELREWSNVYYLKADAARELSQIKDNVSDLNRRVSKLEGEKR